MTEPTHEEMLEIAAEREAIVAKVSDEDYQKIMDEAARREAALASLGIDYENFGQKPWDESMLESLGIDYDDFKGEDDVDYEAPNGDYIKSYPLINRVEVISGDGREFIRYNCSHVQVSEQDNGRTLKVFLT